MSGFKVGDNVRLEGTIINMFAGWVGVRILADQGLGCSSMKIDVLKHATLVEPADKVAENKMLDLSKPVRLISGSEELEFIQLATNGMIIIKWPSGSLDVLTPDEIENIPEPPRTATREMVMVDDGMGTQPYILYDHMEFEEISFVGKIIARGTITLTEGDGMEGVK